MDGEIPRMLLPLLVGMPLLFGSVLFYGAAMSLIVRVVARMVRGGPGRPGFWKNTAVTAIVTLITAAAHLTQIALWAAAYLLCGQFSSFEAAVYFSAENYTALGYGDVLLSDRWRLLGPLEAVNGLLFFGVSTAVLFAIMSRLIADRVRDETGDPGEAAGGREAPSAVGDGWSSGAKGDLHRSAAEDAS